MLAYQLQAALWGDLKPAELRFLADAGGNLKSPGRFDPDSARHQSGTMFVREHAATLHRAVKTPSGFEWNGQEFQSLPLGFAHCPFLNCVCLGGLL